MQIPKRKPGKYTNLKLDFHLTREKLTELKKKLKKLKKIDHPPAVKETQRLAAMGDFSENAAYQIAKGRLHSINERIHGLENQINHAVIIKPAKNKQVVQLGHTVTVEIDGKKKIFRILGSSETDPRAGIISSGSPMGSALLGHRVGDTVFIRNAENTVTCTILRIE